MCDTGQQLDMIRAANAVLYQTNSMDRFAHDFVEKCARWSSTLDRLEVGIWLERPAEWFATSPEILHLERSASEPSPGVLSARTNRVVSVSERSTDCTQPYWSHALAVGRRWIGAVPLEVGNDVIGSMSFYGSCPQDHIDVAERIGEVAVQHFAHSERLMHARRSADDRMLSLAGTDAESDIPHGRSMLCADEAGTLVPLFFAETDIDVARAQMICRQCDNRISCLSGALERQEPRGVWGAKIFYDGVAVDRRRRPGRRRKSQDDVAVLADSA